MESILWKKTIQNGKIFYVDLFEAYLVPSPKNKVLNKNVMKDDKAVIIGFGVIEAMRKKNENLDNIIRRVNKVLCIAETGRNTIGMVYGLRAMLFNDMKQYSSCLVDIALAEKCGLDANIRPNLEEVKHECKEILRCVDRKESTVLDEPKFSFPVDEKNPCFARGLEVKQSKEFGKHIVTNRNLEIGQTVIIEEAFCMTPEDDECYSQCANCFARVANLIPCKNCTAAMFCSQKCQDIGHAIECGNPGICSQLKPVERLVLKTVIKAIEMFPNVKQLMDVVENCINQPTNSELNYTDPTMRAYITFFGLSRNIEKIPIVHGFAFVGGAKTIHAIITSDSAYKSSFESPETSQFLGHLILHHIYVVGINATAPLTLLHGPYRAELGTNEVYANGNHYAWATYPNSSRLNHSCQPNIARIFIGNKLIGKVIRPIKRGEQLFVSYLAPIAFWKTTVERRELLEQFYYFECKCESCLSNSPPYQLCDNMNFDVSICRLLSIFNGWPSGDPTAQCLTVNRNEMLEFEKVAIKFLQCNDVRHPNVQTILIQYVLMQIWNNLGR